MSSRGNDEAHATRCKRVGNRVGGLTTEVGIEYCAMKAKSPERKVVCLFGSGGHSNNTFVYA
jgi:hypothetical protein